MVIGFDYSRKKTTKWAFPAPLRGPGYILAATVFASLAAYLLKRRHSAAKGHYPYRKKLEQKAYNFPKVIFFYVIWEFIAPFFAEDGTNCQKMP